MEITYGWKVGSCIKIDAEIAGQEIESLGNKVTPRLVVSYAETNKESELHKHFEWDNKVAGELYRIHQAGHLLRCITIEKPVSTKKNETKTIIVRAFENVRNDDPEVEDKNIYVPIETAMTIPEYRVQVQEGIRKAIGELREKAIRYNAYINNPAMFNEGIDTVLKAV